MEETVKGDISLMENGKIVRFGSLYLDGKPSECGDIYDHTSRITLGNTYPGQELLWVERNGKYAALSPLLLGVSWDTLNACGLAMGSSIFIDGEEYNCRLPRFGNKPQSHNEWEEFYLGLPKIEAQLVQDNTLSWGADICGVYRSARSGAGMSKWRLVAKDCQQTIYAWRPVLEPIVPALASIPKGTLVRVKFGDGSMLIDGVLVGYSDYDLLLDIRGPMPSATNWYKPDRSGLMAVDPVSYTHLTLPTKA